MQNKMHENYDHPSSIISVSMTLKKSSDFILLFLKNMIISVYFIELFRKVKIDTRAMAMCSVSQLLKLFH